MVAPYTKGGGSQQKKLLVCKIILILRILILYKKLPLVFSFNIKIPYINKNPRLGVIIIKLFSVTPPLYTNTPDKILELELLISNTFRINNYIRIYK